VFNTKYSDYQVSLYEVDAEKREVWLAKGSVSFGPFLRKYEEEFRKLD
jgi:hypothetical protein